jgi:hypothetical protein
MSRYIVNQCIMSYFGTERVLNLPTTVTRKQNAQGKVHNINLLHHQ